MTTRQRVFIGGASAGAALTLIGMAAMERAHAQDPGQGGQGGRQGGGFGGGRGGGGFGGGQGGPGGGQTGPGVGFFGGPGGMMGGGGGASIAATDKYVYILRGNTLYQYSVEGLKLLAKAELPQPPRPQGGFGGGGFPGGPGGPDGPPPTDGEKSAK